MKNKICGIASLFLVAVLLLSSCTTTYTAVLQGGQGGSVPSFGANGQGNSAQQSTEKNEKELPEDHLFYEKPVDSVYEGFSESGYYLLVNFSAGLSQAMGEGKYLFEQQTISEQELSDLKAEIVGKSPFLAVPGQNGYVLYALKEYQDLKRVVISFEEESGERVLGLYEYRPIEKEELESLFWSDEIRDSLLDSLIKAGAAAAEGTQGYEGFEYKKNGYRSAFFIANYNMEKEQPEDNRTPCFALALPIFESELITLARNADALFYLYYRPLYSGVAYTEERAAVATRYPMGDGSTIFAIPVQNDERVLTSKKDTLYRDYEFLVVCVNQRTGKKLFYKQINARWNTSSEAFFKYAKDHGYLY